MSSNKCPAHEQNKQAHAAFLHAFAILKDRYQTEGSKPELLDSIQRTASEWIKYHILTVDINLRACMNN
jgi:hemerythrin